MGSDMEYIIDALQLTLATFAIPFMLLGAFWFSLFLIFIVVSALSGIRLVSSAILGKIKRKK